MFFSQTEMLIRLALSVALGGIIGYERELSGRDAGIRTHAIVSVGSSMMALIQLSSSEWLLNYAMQNPEHISVLSSDITRFIAQIISGIGFLGAGTIIVSRRSVTGLTTAATLWAVAGLGISIGMGYYTLGVSGAVFILILLRTIKVVFRMGRDKNIEIHYEEDKNVIKFIEKYFEEKNIKVIAADYSFSYLTNGKKFYKIIYEIHMPKQIKLKDLVYDISMNQYILKVSTIKLN